MSYEYYGEEEDMRTWKAMPLLQALLVSILIPVVLAVVFTFAGAATNPLLLQIELILVAIAFCSMGILTRSKSRGLLSIIAAPISWGILYLADTLSGGFIVNPYGLISGLAEPLAAIAQSPLLSGLAGDMGIITQVAIIIDLIIVEFFAFFLGFFLAMLATGLWKKDGSFAIISVPFKLIAAAFVIGILAIVPFAYHGIGTLADGGISLGAGAAEIMGMFGADLAGGGAQAGLSLDLNNATVLAELSAAAARAEAWFRRSSISFKQAQENILIQAALNALFPEGSDFRGLNMREITSILSISDILVSISSELPALLAGYQNFANGFDITFSILGQTSIGGGQGGSIETVVATYDPYFVVGLNNMSAALDNFTDAQDGILDAIAGASAIINQIIVDQTSDYAIITDLIDEMQAFFPILLDVARSGVFFLNGTYKTALSIEDIGDNDFDGANFWLDSAAQDLGSANSTLQNVSTSALDPNSPLPFWGTVEIIRDLVNLLGWFTRAAANTTECYTRIDDVLISLNALDFQGTSVLATNWDNLSANVSAANTIFDAAQFNIGQATSLSDQLSSKSYGPVIDGSLGSAITDFSNMMMQFTHNITEVDYLLDALEYTVFSFQSFTEGFALFNSTFDYASSNSADGPTFISLLTGNATWNQTKDKFGYSIANSSLGWIAIDTTTVIAGSVRTSWKNMLYTPSWPITPPTEPSIAGLSQTILDLMAAIETLAEYANKDSNAALIQTAFEGMDSNDPSTIFGGG
ncbi:MAG: hypothetical protein ACFFE8_07280 [Candidatus Heimdallarchaeota archaeon]